MAVLQYDIAVVGTSGINKAFSSIERRMVQHNRRADAIFGKQPKGGTRGANPAAKASQSAKSAERIQIAAANNVAKAEIAAAKTAAKVKAGQAKEAGRAQERAAKEAVRAQERAAKEATRANERQAKAAEKAAKEAQGVKERAVKSAALAEERLAKESAREAKRVASEKIRAEKRVERERIASIIRVNRVEKRQFLASQRAQAKGARDQVARAGAIRGAAAGSIGRIGGVVGATASIGGGFAVAGAIGSQIREEKLASQLAIQGNAPGRKGEVLGQIQNVVGFTGEEAGGAVGQFVDLTGNLDVALAQLQTFGKMSLATGANVEDFAAASGNAFNTIAKKVKDPQKRIELLNQTMAVLAKQGELGAVELKDLATGLAGVAATAGQFAGDPADLIGKVAGFAQLARGGGGAQSAAEAVTSAVRFQSDVTKKGTQLGKSVSRGGLGLDVFTDKSKSKLKDPTEILADILAKTGGDLTKLTKIFGERSIRVVQGAKDTFLEAGGGEAGRQAVLAETKRLGAGKITDEQIEARNRARQADPDIILKETMKKFNRQVGKQLLPVLINIIPHLADLGEAFAKTLELMMPLIKFIAENPFTGLGGIVAAAVTKDILAAGIGKQMAQTTTGSIQQAGVGTAAKTTLSGVLAAAGIGAVVGASIAAIITAVGQTEFNKGEREVTAGGKQLNRLRDLDAKAKSGKSLSPRELREAKQIQASLDASVLKEGGRLRSVGRDIGLLDEGQVSSKRGFANEGRVILGGLKGESDVSEAKEGGRRAAGLLGEFDRSLLGTNDLGIGEFALPERESDKGAKTITQKELERAATLGKAAAELGGAFDTLRKQMDGVTPDRGAGITQPNPVSP